MAAPAPKTMGGCFVVTAELHMDDRAWRPSYRGNCHCSAARHLAVCLGFVTLVIEYLFMFYVGARELNFLLTAAAVCINRFWRRTLLLSGRRAMNGLKPNVSAVQFSREKVRSAAWSANAVMLLLHTRT